MSVVYSVIDSQDMLNSLRPDKLANRGFGRSDNTYIVISLQSCYCVNEVRVLACISLVHQSCCHGS